MIFNYPTPISSFFQLNRPVIKNSVPDLLETPIVSLVLIYTTFFIQFQIQLYACNIDKINSIINEYAHTVYM